MNAKDRWIDEGMAVLTDQGIDGVRIDRVAARLDLTKGSFHHHFRGAGDYRRSLLDSYEQRALAMIDDALSQLGHLSPTDALMALPGRFDFNTRLEAAMRGWAFQDAEARAVLERVDAARLKALVDLWQGIVADPARARSAALIPFLVMVGAAVALPALTENDVTELFELLARLVPAVSD